MKGQMFILTMVFLAGLIFAVQQGLLVYSYTDLSEPFIRPGEEYIDDVVSMFNAALRASPNCQEAEENLEELSAFLFRRIFTGASLETSYLLECTRWGNTPPNPAPLNFTVTLKTGTSTLKKESELYRFG